MRPVKKYLRNVGIKEFTYVYSPVSNTNSSPWPGSALTGYFYLKNIVSQSDYVAQVSDT